MTVDKETIRDNKFSPNMTFAGNKNHVRMKTWDGKDAVPNGTECQVEL